MSETGLAAYSTDELLAEIVRRRNQTSEERTVPWCHECAHFKTWAKRGDPPTSYNPCAKTHRVLFHMPEPWESPEDYGYYRPVCADRKAIHEAVREAALPPRGVP